MPLKMEKGNDVTPGNHTGVMFAPRIESNPVTKVRNGREVTEEAVYCVVDVKTDGCENILKASWSAKKLTPDTQLGRLLDRLDMTPEEGGSFDEKDLDGIRISYVVIPDGHFVRIDAESVRPE